MTERLHIHDWDTHQSYRKDRGQPPWIKMHRSALRNPKWVALSDAHQGQLVNLWLLAADDNGWIPADPQFLKKICCLDSVPDLDLFISYGFIDPRRQGDDSMTSTRRHPDAPEAETEAEGETEAETETALSGSDEIDRVVEIVNTHRERAGLTLLRGGDQAGRRYIRARIRDYDFATVEAVAWCAPHDKWIRETTERLALGPIFSPRSFPRILDRLENDHDAASLPAGDRKIIDMRERLYRQEGA